MPKSEAKYHAELQRTQELCDKLTDEQVLKYAAIRLGQSDDDGTCTMSDEDLEEWRDKASQDHEYWDEISKEIAADRRSEGHV